MDPPFVFILKWLELEHFEGGEGGFFAFVAVFAASAVEGLLLVEGCEDAEDYGLAGFE